MTQLEELKTFWKDKQDEVGALRLQSSDGDCVPTTVINALLYLTGDRIHPKLQRLIWSVALDEGPLTGWVGCQLVSDVISAWSDWTHKDGNAGNKKRKFISEIRANHVAKKFDVTQTLKDIHDCIEAEGVVCLTCNKGGHYALLHSFDGSFYYGFDSYFSNGDRLLEAAFTKCNDLSSMTNFMISKPKLENLLKDKDESNQWVHLIKRP